MTEVKPRDIATGAPLPAGARILERVARPLTGIEIRDGLTAHLEEVAGRFKLETSPRPIFVQDLLDSVQKKLANTSELNKINIVYPGVGWKILVHREILAGETVGFWAEVELDLKREHRINIIIGQQGRGVVDETIEDEQIQSKQPDEVRAKHALPVTADYVVPSTGQRGKVQMARSVEIGRASQSPMIIRDETGLKTQAQSTEYWERTKDETPAEMPVEDIVGTMPGTSNRVVPEVVPQVIKDARPPIKKKRVSYTELKKKADEAAARIREEK